MSDGGAAGDVDRLTRDPASVVRSQEGYGWSYVLRLSGAAEGRTRDRVFLKSAACEACRLSALGDYETRIDTVYTNFRGASSLARDFVMVSTAPLVEE